MRRFLAPVLMGLAIIVLVGIDIATTHRASTDEGPAPPLPKEVLVPPRVTLASLDGLPVAINFWASWCKPCREEAPELQTAFHELRGQAHVIGVDVTDDRGDAKAFIDEHEVTYPNLRDPSGRTSDDYDLRGLPTTVIVDAGGQIVERLQGPQTAASVAAALRAARE